MIKQMWCGLKPPSFPRQERPWIETFSQDATRGGSYTTTVIVPGCKCFLGCSNALSARRLTRAYITSEPLWWLEVHTVALNTTFNTCMDSQETNALLWLTGSAFNLFINPLMTVGFPLWDAFPKSTSARDSYDSRYLMSCYQRKGCVV